MFFDLDRKAFMQLAREYRSRWPVSLLACDPTGGIQFASPGGRERMKKQPPPPEVKHTRALAIAEALRWGEPTFHLCAPPPAPGKTDPRGSAPRGGPARFVVGIPPRQHGQLTP
ncbi:MAG: hypothetical protein WC058_16265, partial [Phycisphaeraceae bacterium]